MWRRGNGTLGACALTLGLKLHVLRVAKVAVLATGHLLEHARQGGLVVSPEAAEHGALAIPLLERARTCPRPVAQQRGVQLPSFPAVGATTRKWSACNREVFTAICASACRRIALRRCASAPAARPRSVATCATRVCAIIASAASSLRTNVRATAAVKPSSSARASTASTLVGWLVRGTLHELVERRHLWFGEDMRRRPWTE